MKTNTTSNKICPFCGSVNIGLYNSRQQIYHCHDCESYFNKYGRKVIVDNEPNYGGSAGGWNSFTDPDDFPTDGFGEGGW